MMGKYGTATIDVGVDIEDFVYNEFDTIIRILENEHDCIISYKEDLPKRSLVDQMKYDYFLENFNNITLEDLEGIVNERNSNN